MWGYIAVLLIGFWLGVAIFLYASCYWLEEILDLPPRQEYKNSASINAPSTGASNAHAQLKRLVARVVEEAASLPALARYASEPSRTPTSESSTYEDLLATAILNKVIEKYQTENGSGSGGRSSGIHSASASPTPSERSSPRSLNCMHRRDITPPLHEEDEPSDWEEGEATDDALDLPRRNPFPEFGDDILNSTDNADRDFDEVSGSDIQAIDGSWEENWLFQKKKIKTLQSVPVPMLVPNSNTEYRVLIGDRDVDDTTDLSDNASDSEEEAEYKSDIKRVLDSKNLIGGGKILIDTQEDDFEPDSLTILDNDLDENRYKNQPTDAVNEEVDGTLTVDTVNKDLITQFEGNKDSVLIYGIGDGPVQKAEFNIKEEIHRTLLNGLDNQLDSLEYDQNINEDEKEDQFAKNRELSQNTLNGHEREGEYEETVTLPVQRYADSLRRKHFDDRPQIVPTRDTDKDEDLIPGSIADRERKKWLNYVEMPNNPYSPEAIQKRLSAKSTSSLFDMITKSKDLEEVDEIKKSKSDVNLLEDKNLDEVPVKEPINNANENVVQNDQLNGERVKSPSPKILKDVLADEVPQYKRYGRDYYIKEARVSSGGRKKNAFSETSSVCSKTTSVDNLDNEFASTGSLIKQFNTIATNRQYTTFASKDQPKQCITITSNENNTKNILIEYEEVNDQTLFSAKPAYVHDETDQKFEELLKETRMTVEIEKRNEPSFNTPTSDNLENSFMSSSSFEDSIKIYNVQTGEIVKCKPEDNVSSRYDAKDDSNDTDKEHDGSLTVDIVEHDSEADDEFPYESNVNLSVIQEIEDIKLPKVKDLAKKFGSMDHLNEIEAKPQPQTKLRKKSRDNILTDKPMNKQAYMHSLTARSISREFRDELKLSFATPLKVPGGTKEVPDGIEEVTKESSRPSSPLPEPGTIKTKLAFFESLKNKLSYK